MCCTSDREARRFHLTCETYGQTLRDVPPENILGVVSVVFVGSQTTRWDDEYGELGDPSGTGAELETPRRCVQRRFVRKLASVTVNIDGARSLGPPGRRYNQPLWELEAKFLIRGLPLPPPPSRPPGQVLSGGCRPPDPPARGLGNGSLPRSPFGGVFWGSAAPNEKLKGSGGTSNRGRKRLLCIGDPPLLDKHRVPHEPRVAKVLTGPPSNKAPTPR
jgi:hypothetical protein